jgi:preprotein translocase subunit SecE
VSPSLRALLPQRSEQAAGGKAAARPARPVAQAAAKPASPARENRLVRFYRETESELKKVVWPTRKEWTNLTLVVVVTTVGMGAFLGIVDFIFERLILLIR